MLYKLYAEFKDKDPDYGIKRTRIDYFYELSYWDYEETRKFLQNDKDIRNKIKTLQEKKEKYEYPRDKLLIANCLDIIHGLVEKRNAPIFERIEQRHPSQLIFDLHWFTVQEATFYAHDVSLAMKESSKRLTQNSEEVVFITGRGERSEEKEYSIREALLKEFENTRLNEKNCGRVFMHFRKNLTYADVLDEIWK